MQATAKFAPANDPSEADQETQYDCILQLLKIGDDQARWRQYREATLTYYSIFEPGVDEQSTLGISRVAPIELYERAASSLRAVASTYAEKLMAHGCFLPAESHDGIIGLPRGALNLYLISNQYDVFRRHALQYAAEEQAKRDIKRFLMSSVRARLGHLRSVEARAPLLSEEQAAFGALANFEVELRRYLAPRRHEPRRCAGALCK